MGRFILRRLLVIVPMLLVVVSLTWALIRLAPGNFYSGEKKLPAAIERNIREKYGLDKPTATMTLSQGGMKTTLKRKVPGLRPGTKL